MVTRQKPQASVQLSGVPDEVRPDPRFPRAEGQPHYLAGCKLQVNGGTHSSSCSVTVFPRGMSRAHVFKMFILDSYHLLTFAIKLMILLNPR